MPLPLDTTKTRELLALGEAEQHQPKVTKLELECPPPRSAARLLDKLCGHYIEDHIAACRIV